MPYFENSTTDDITNDITFKDCIIYLAITPILYFALLIILEEKLLPKLFMKIIGTKLRKEQDVMDDQVKKEKLAVAVEINKINQSKIIFSIFQEMIDV